MNTVSKIVKYDYIDAMRGWAILGVVSAHCVSQQLPILLRDIVGAGSIGVQLFFVVSACTLFLSLSARRSEKGFIFNFFIRRIFRVAPLYYIAIIYFLFQDGLGPRYWLGDASGITVWNILSNIFFIHGINPYWINSLVPGGWSITDEVMFYSILPILFYMIRTINHAFYFFFASLFLKGILHLILSSTPLISEAVLWNSFLFFYFPNQLPVFLCGVLLFFFISTPQEQLKISPMVYLMFLLIVLFELFTKKHVVSYHIKFGLAFVLMGYMLSLRPYSLLVNRFTRYVGKVSFGIYFTHFAVLHYLESWCQETWGRLLGGHWCVQYINRWGGPFLFQYCIVLLISLAVSSLLYYWIEIPCQSFGAQMIRKRIDKYNRGINGDIILC